MTSVIRNKPFSSTQVCEGVAMENEKNISNDVLHFENHSKLSVEDIAKAVKRHDRQHKGGAKKDVLQAKAPGKRH
jgi:hypothetical protein